MKKKEKLQEITNKYYIRCLTKEEFGKILELFESKLSIDYWDIYKQEIWYNGGIHDSFLRCEKGIDEILASDVIKEFDNKWLIEDGEKIIRCVSPLVNSNTEKTLERILGKNSNIHLKPSFPNILERPTSQTIIEEKTKETMERIDKYIKNSFEKTKDEYLKKNGFKKEEIQEVLEKVMVEKKEPILEKIGDNQKVTKEELEHELEKVIGECQILPNSRIGLREVSQERIDVLGKLGNNDVEFVHHPNHYGGKNNVYEAIKIIEAHDLNFNEGNVIKYLLRYKKKNGFEDLEKALWYMNRLVENYKKTN